MANHDSEPVELFGIIQHETDKALLVDFGEKEPVWIAKSQIHEQHALKSGTSFTIPEWVAKEKGLV